VTVGDIGSVATAVGVIVAAGPLWLARSQARSQFEDGLVTEYRRIASLLPVEALLGAELPTKKLEERLSAFYQYVDLTNEQIYLRQKGRIRRNTWTEWLGGIEGHLARPAFDAAWKRIKLDTGIPDFTEYARLRQMVLEAGEKDPRRW
jgi:hypothetical protein